MFSGKPCNFTSITPQSAVPLLLYFSYSCSIPRKHHRSLLPAIILGISLFFKYIATIISVLSICFFSVLKSPLE